MPGNLKADVLVVVAEHKPVELGRRPLAGELRDNVRLGERGT